LLYHKKDPPARQAHPGRLDHMAAQEHLLSFHNSLDRPDHPGHRDPPGRPAHMGHREHLW